MDLDFIIFVQTELDWIWW